MGSVDLDMSITGLLDDLLANQPSSDVAAQPFERVSEEDATQDAASLAQDGQRAEDEARQLAELCGEMDSCLASLGDWESQRDREREELKKQLEAQYGFSYEEALASPDNTDGYQHDFAVEHDASEDSGADGADLESVPIGGHRAPACASKQIASSVPLSCLTPLPASGKVGQLLEDEARLAKLRAEVEALRRQEAQADQEALRAEADALFLDSSHTGAADSLTSWCKEVDAALDGHCNEDGIDVLDARLADAHKQGNSMQAALDDARARLDSELGDLDKMLAECNSIQTKIGIS